MAGRDNFNQSVTADSEIDIKDEQIVKLAQSVLKPNVSDDSDIEVLAVCKTSPKRRLLLKPIYNRKKRKISLSPANDGTIKNYESSIKEEIIISDESDSDYKKNTPDDSSKVCVNGHVSPQETNHQQNESLSAITLNCPRCNRTEKVFSITLMTNCKECKDCNMYYVCSKCQNKYDSMSALYRHIKLQCRFIKSKAKKTKIVSMMIMKCPVCDQVQKVNLSKKSLTKCSNCNHVMNYECLVCSKTYCSQSGIYKHVQRYCQLKRHPYYCNDCAYSCTKQSTILRHLKRNHNEYFQKLTDHVCPKCNSTKFDSTEHFKRHELLCGLINYRCKFCNYKPKDSKKIEKHLLDHHSENVEMEGLDKIIASIAENKNSRGVPPLRLKKNDFDHFKKLFCRNCQKTDDYVINLCVCPTCKNSYLYQCVACMKQFFTSNSLHRHIQRIHAEHKFTCVKCGRGYAYMGDRNEHMKTCCKAYNYECKLCEFKTCYRQSLNSHIFRLHSNKRKSFECKICGAAYKTNRAMSKHIQTCN